MLRKNHFSLHSSLIFKADKSIKKQLALEPVSDSRHSSEKVLEKTPILKPCTKMMLAEQTQEVL